MASERLCRQLADRIREILGKGLQLSPGVLHYIDSTYLNPSPEALKEIFYDLSDAQNASLCELIFSPDETFQVQIENLLEESMFHPADEKKVLSFLLRATLRVELFFSGKNFSLRTEMPPGGVERFLSRLNIAQHPEPKITGAVNQFLDGHLKTLTKVRLRHAKIEFTGERIQFLCRFLGGVDPNASEFLPCFDLILDILGEKPNDDHLFRWLINKKRFYFKGLQVAEKFAARLKKSNMETLMIEGFRTPYVDPADARKRMMLIDMISRAVFGKTEYFEKTSAAVRIEEYEKPRKMKRTPGAAC